MSNFTIVKLDMAIPIDSLTELEKLEIEKIFKTIGLYRMSEVLMFLAEREISVLKSEETSKDEEIKEMTKINIAVLAAAAEIIEKVNQAQIDQLETEILSGQLSD